MIPPSGILGKVDCSLGPQKAAETSNCVSRNENRP
jgi:hypothetical protein